MVFQSLGYLGLTHGVPMSHFFARGTQWNTVKHAHYQVFYAFYKLTYLFKLMIINCLVNFNFYGLFVIC